MLPPQVAEHGWHEALVADAQHDVDHTDWRRNDGRGQLMVGAVDSADALCPIRVLCTIAASGTRLLPLWPAVVSRLGDWRSPDQTR